ncbi:kynureninase [Roseobacter sp. HKCCA0434]|uniref:kynureninase n=1 Tax=Roseobacter sp. HKCCA0434 TaxID=3079297 RepID=UPI002905F2F2|nr:kynureninase [Roseobacter sp. HKCCA0434]
MTDFSATRARFALPADLIYLDGNSLGPVPRAATERVSGAISDEWGRMLIGGWVQAGWMDQPMRLGDRIGRLIGAEPGQVVLGDTLSIKLYQALAAALAQTSRRVVLTDTGNFPSDLYMAEGLMRTLDAGHELRRVAPEEVEVALTDEVGVLMLTECDYRTGRLHDMAALTARAHEVGALTIWDLAHSAGALPINLAGARADYAVGCTYKYLNGGPGAPAFIYVSPRHSDRALPALSGWLGHDAPFDFSPDYVAGQGVSRMRVGTPPVLQMAALDAALDIWEGVDMQALRRRSIELSELFIQTVEAGTDLELASPRDASRRGSHVSFRHDSGYAVMQALIARGVVGDFRAPDILRFGITPLFLDEGDIRKAADTLIDILATGAWDRPEFHRRKAVT